MANPLGPTLAGCALTLLIGMSGAHAASGRIAFSGAVVEPTCSTAGPGSVEPGDGPTVWYSGCSGASAGTDSRTYSREVLDLATANRYPNRLLDYFASYAPRATEGDTVKVVVYTYD